MSSIQSILSSFNQLSPGLHFSNISFTSVWSFELLLSFILGHGANSQSGQILLTKLPSGHSFASIAQTTFMSSFSVFIVSPVLLLLFCWVVVSSSLFSSSSLSFCFSFFSSSSSTKVCQSGVLHCLGYDSRIG
jgi:hypothetical protein